MPETAKEINNVPTEPEAHPVEALRPSRKSSFSTGYSSDEAARKPVSEAVAQLGVNETQDPELPWFRINWEIKALVPIACVLLGGMLLFLLATLSWRDPERHLVLLVAGAGAVAICGALLVVLTYTVQRPMVELQQKIAQLGRGDLGVSVSFSRRNDEIGDLGRNFNQMVEQLRESRVEIERLHRTQMSRAEHMATLGEMATGLAHEIRNPLAGIAGVIEIIGRDLPDSSPARAVVKDVRQEIARINRIVSDLLQTARPHPPKVRKSDLNTTVEHAVMLGRQQGLSKGVEITLHKDPSLPEIEHDSDQIHQVMLNLLLNAIHAIDGNGKIAVTVELQGTNAVIEVADNGRGISPDLLPNIFRPFFTTKGDGTGLGLSLALRIIEDHQGRIDVTSAVGKGTTFSVVLPLQRAVSSQAAAAAVKPTACCHSGRDHALSSARHLDGRAAQYPVPFQTQCVQSRWTDFSLFDSSFDFSGRQVRMPEPAAANPLTIVVERTSDCVAVRCTGRLVAGMSNRFYLEVSQLIPSSKRIVLDFTDLTHMDSTGLGALVRLYVSAKSAGCALQLFNLGKPIRQLLGATHLVSVFQIIGDNNIRCG